MTVKTKLSLKDYTNSRFIILCHRSVVKALIALLSTIIVFNLIIGFTSNESRLVEQFSLPVIIGIVCFVMYLSSKRTYLKNKRLSETTIYHFSEDFYTVMGESYSIELSWKTIPKATLTSNWLLLWQNNIDAHAIPRRNIEEGLIDKLRMILARHNVNNNL